MITPRRGILLYLALILGLLIFRWLMTPSFIWPLEDFVVSSKYNSFRSLWTRHKGIDLQAPAGTPVLAIGDGVVVFSGIQKGYGKLVIIQQDHYQVLYGHLKEINVAMDQDINKGDTIGFVGQTGNASSAHLHLEIRDPHNGPINPLNVLPTPLR
ncbi:M23 family metallopeptidase [Pseudobacteriovorax antillogorgiicola]|uniref:Peptidase family M23 n=1 Tax=Pseudobacteriovorax antillogorgiicola TaxID=1513793 RepID=A0A1Y6CM96_9BACT|nr:M23 family metallopeptidase [Pseudobacteriovorax antillogorgiicola]TCS46921.1 peptidase M23-like protein [Pseudobacteriovorax antillogorgiicola]SMF64219.1 Peptidase family M23 [Pseudobacteriovorax antillogorgiicola]